MRTLAVLAPTVLLTLALGACSKSPDSAAAPASSTASSSSVPHDITAGNTPNVCVAKDLQPADMADILTLPVVKVSTPETNAEQCKFETSQNTAWVSVTLRKGDEVDPFWNMIAKSGVNALPLPGVGEKALRTSDGTGVFARKGDLMCQVDSAGTDSGVIKAKGEELAKKLGALCNKVFATHP
jgi:hypothetical protein